LFFEKEGSFGMKRWYIMVVCIMAVGLLCSCETNPQDSGNNSPVLEPESTGITPTLGHYRMSVDGKVPFNGYLYQTKFVVTATNMISYTSDTFTDYSIPIHDGGVSFSNGQHLWMLNGEKVEMQDSVHTAPTDKFAFYAKWTSPNRCEGIMWFSTTNGLPFTADIVE
jgi:hypothetical protein